MGEKIPPPNPPPADADASVQTPRSSPPDDIAQRWARCCMRFALLVVYYLFLYTTPSGKFSPSTIADAGDGTTFYAAIRSCTGTSCTEWLQSQAATGTNQHASTTFSQAFVAVGSLVTIGFFFNFLGLVGDQHPSKEEPKRRRERLKRRFAMIGMRCRILSRIIAYLIVPSITFLGLVLSADASLETTSYKASLLLGGAIALFVSWVLSIQALMPNNAAKQKGRTGKVICWMFFFPCLTGTKLAALIASRRGKSNAGSRV